VDDIPWWIRQAVTTRDQRCRWPGGCDQPAAASQPHHVIHRFEHGTTSAGNLKLLCYFHHHVVIHRWGWNFTVNGDGTPRPPAPTVAPTGQTAGHPHPAPGETPRQTATAQADQPTATSNTGDRRASLCCGRERSAGRSAHLTWLNGVDAKGQDVAGIQDLPMYGYIQYPL
jgi:hypothetical protein